jgi:RNA polymerase sigma-B factor
LTELLERLFLARREVADIAIDRPLPIRSMSTEMLHEQFAATREPHLRDELVLRHERLAKSIAARACNHTHDRDDRMQVAMVGLLNAVERFDPTRGISFSTFAWATITGELKRFHRNSGWAAHVPRSLQEVHLRVTAAIEHLTNELGRSPTMLEIAAHTGDTEEMVVAGIEVNHARSTVSLDGPSRLDGDISIEPPSPSDEAALVEDRLAVEELLSLLPARSQEIVRLRFHHELSQSQIAAHVGLSQMHVSRLLSQALRTMREAAEARAHSNSNSN